MLTKKQLTKKQSEILTKISNGLIVVIIPELGQCFTPYDTDKNPQYRTIQALRDKDKVQFDLSKKWSKNKKQSWYVVRAK